MDAEAGFFPRHSHPEREGKEPASVSGFFPRHSHPKREGKKPASVSRIEYLAANALVRREEPREIRDALLHLCGERLLHLADGVVGMRGGGFTRCRFGRLGSRKATVVSKDPVNTPPVSWRSKLDNPRSKAHINALILIMISGLALRLYSLVVGQAYHYSAMNDEIGGLHYALRLLAGDSQALYLGQPHFAGAQLPGPFWTLFLAGAYTLGGRTVEGAALVMLLLNTAVIYLVYRLARHFLTPQFALFTALIYAVSAWPVYYSAGIWTPLTLPLLGSLLLLALWQTSTTNQSRAIFWVCLLSAFTPQFHMIGVFYLPAVLLILSLCSARLNRKWLALGMVAGLLVYLPYLVGDALNGWENTSTLR